MACYRYDNPFQGLSLLRANFGIIADFVPGRATELLSGKHYIPLDQSVPDQIWSSGNTLTALVEGLLGFTSDRKTGKITLRPALPLHWSAAAVKRLRVFGGSIDLEYRRLKGAEIEFSIRLRGLEGTDLDFVPRFPARKIHLYRGEALIDIPLTPLACDQPDFAINIRGQLEGYFYPYVRQDPVLGQESRSPIIQKLYLAEGECRVTLWGRGTQRLFFCSDRTVTNHEVFSDPGGDHVSLDFDDEEWQRKTVIFRFGDILRRVRREQEDDRI
jgi:hypothetical protein